MTMYRQLFAEFVFLVGARGFEPPTTATPLRCATRLRYTPKVLNDTGNADGDRTPLRAPGSALEDEENVLELGAQLADDLLALIDVHLGLLAGEPLAGTADGEAVLVEQAADLTD